MYGMYGIVVNKLWYDMVHKQVFIVAIVYLCTVWYGWHGGDHMGTIIATLRVDQQNGLPALIEFHGSQQNGILFVKRQTTND